jgi:hypothetical protein
MTQEAKSNHLYLQAQSSVSAYIIQLILRDQSVPYIFAAVI